MAFNVDFDCWVKRPFVEDAAVNRHALLAGYHHTADVLYLGLLAPNKAKQQAHDHGGNGHSDYGYQDSAGVF